MHAESVHPTTIPDPLHATLHLQRLPSTWRHQRHVNQRLGRRLERALDKDPRFGDVIRAPVNKGFAFTFEAKSHNKRHRLAWATAGRCVFVHVGVTIAEDRVEHVPMETLERLERDLSRDLGRCIHDFGLIEEGDRIMVCLSGGKDSYTMLHLLERARKKSPVKFSLLAMHLDQGHPGYDGTPLENFLKDNGYDYKIIREDTYKIVVDKIEEGKTYCSLCSRLRRGVLYNAAQELGCTKIALGHHRDDAIETLLLNLMFTGSLKSMPPKLISDDERNIVIRPLLYAAESTIQEFSNLMRFPILPCDLCGSQENLMRKQVKNVLTTLEGLAPRVRESMLAALMNVKPSHLFDNKLWTGLGLAVAKESEDRNVPLPSSRRLPLLS